MNRNGRFEFGQKVHYMVSNLLRENGVSYCGRYGHIKKTDAPIDCKVCLRYMAKRAQRERKE